jgi:type I restriction enzyme S subunit
VSRYPLVPLGEVLTLVRDEVRVEPEGTYRPAGIYSFGRGLFARSTLTGSETKYPTLLRLHENQFVYSRLKAWEGALAVVTTEFDGLCVSQEFPTFELDRARVEPSYLGWLCRWEHLWESLLAQSKGLGARRDRVHPDRLLAVEVPLPPIGEQLRIAQYLGRIARLAQAIRHHAQEVTEVGEHLYPAVTESLLTAHASGYVPVGELVNFVADVIHPGDDPAPAKVFVGLQHIESHAGRRVGEESIGNEQGRKFRFSPGDVVYGYLRPYLNKVWLADRHGLCSVDQYVLRPKGILSGGLIAHALRSRGFLLEAMALTHNLQLPRLRSGLLAQIRIPVPSRSERKELEDALDNLQEAAVRLLSLWRERHLIADTVLAGALNQVLTSAQS